jgi:hypothetical protein
MLSLRSVSPQAIPPAKRVLTTTSHTVKHSTLEVKRQL